MAAYGMDESMLPEHVRKPAEYEVWPEHQEAVLMFLRCSTQWRTGPMGHVGLDYCVVLELMGLYAVDDRRQTLEDLQIMEARALELIEKRNKREVKR